MTGERRTGLTRHNARPLLKVVGHQNRSDYDRARNATRYESSDSSPDRADASKLKPAFPSKKRQRSEDDTKAIGGIPRIDSIDDLANANAPTAAAGVGGRSRQTSSEPSRKGRPEPSNAPTATAEVGGRSRQTSSEPPRKGRPEPASQTTSRTLALSEEELESTSSFSTCTFLGGISAGKDILQAKNGATQTYSQRAAKEPDSTWDGFGSRKKGYKSRPVSKFGPNPKGASYKAGLKASKPPNTNASDGDKDTGKQSKDGNNGFQNPFIKYPMTHKSTGTTAEPPMAAKPQSSFINPILKYGLPIDDNTYKECSMEKKGGDIGPKTMTNPFKKYSLLGPTNKSTTANGDPRSPPEVLDLTSSPQTTGTGGSSQTLEPHNLLSTSDRETMDAVSGIAAAVGLSDFEVLRRKINLSENVDQTARCRLCKKPLQEGYLDRWSDQTTNGHIKLDVWMQICEDHTKRDLQVEWSHKGYPTIEWKALRARATRHLKVLRDIIADRVDSEYRTIFEDQQRQIGGQTIKLLRQDHTLPFPGYYGPRGADILLDTLTAKLGSKVNDAARTDSFIARVGVGAFIQHVLVPELGVRLIAEDMKVSDDLAAKILEESRAIGEKLNSEYLKGDLYDERDADKWIDVAATSNQVREDSDSDWSEMDY